MLNKLEPWEMKEYWLDGPWKTEPDYEYFKYKGYNCFIVRQTWKGNLNGYVFIPKDNKYAKPYQEIEDLGVHGGLTFSGDFLPFGATIPDNIDIKDYVVLGFDCAHFNDIWPAYEAHKRWMRESLDPVIKKLSNGLTDIDQKYSNYVSSWELQKSYKDFPFVKDQLKKLVRQVIKGSK